MSEQAHVRAELQFANEALQRRTLRSLACDDAEEFQPALFQNLACADQEGVVFHRMQPAGCEHDEPLRRCARRRNHPVNCLDPHPANGDFCRIDVGIMIEYVLPVELRNCYAETAILKLRISRYHRHPGCKISVMNVDVSNASPLKAQRAIRSQPGVEYGAKPPERRFSSVNQHT